MAVEKQNFAPARNRMAVAVSIIIISSSIFFPMNY